jgi:Pentapeptide repeats (8 copies)
MADEEHLKILFLRGVAAWNERRENNPELIPDLGEANLSGANLSGADLRATLLLRTDLRGASLDGSSVYGASVWDIKIDEGTKQQNLVITHDYQPVITVDNIEVAQFIYLLLNNQAFVRLSTRSPPKQC